MERHCTVLTPKGISVSLTFMYFKQSFVSASWDIATGKSLRVFPDVHTTMITGINATSKGDLVTVSWDDHIKVVPAGSSGVDSTKTISNKLSSQPLGLAVASDGSVAVAACYKHIAIYENGKLTEVPINYNSLCVALSTDKQFVAVGGHDLKVHVYKLSGNSLSEVKAIVHAAEITAVSFSNNGAYLIATDQSRKVQFNFRSSGSQFAFPGHSIFRRQQLRACCHQLVDIPHCKGC